MTDNLTDRIAKTLAAVETFGDADDYTRMAAAIVAELGLDKDCLANGCMWLIPDDFTQMNPEQKRLLSRRAGDG